MLARASGLLLAAMSVACASTGAVPRPFPSPGAVTPPAAGVDAAGVPDAYALAGTALSFRGVPYRNGGADPSGFDCSGLVWFVFARHGVSVPRSVVDQFRAGTEVSGSLLPGDLVFFSTVSSGPSHVGILVGGDEFVHAPTSAGTVRVERLSGAYWAGRYLGARRLISP
jgi:cell wall-associated NlpC family hydrolase